MFCWLPPPAVQKARWNSRGKKHQELRVRGCFGLGAEPLPQPSTPNRTQGCPRSTVLPTPPATYRSGIRPYEGKLSWEVVALGVLTNPLYLAALGLLGLLGLLPAPAPAQAQGQCPATAGSSCASAMPPSTALRAYLGQPRAPPLPLLTLFTSPPLSSAFPPLFTPLHPFLALPTLLSRLQPSDLFHRPSFYPSYQPAPQTLCSAHSYQLSLRLYGAVDHPAQDFRLRVQLDAGQALPLPLRGGEGRAWGQERKGVRAGLWLHEGRG